MPDCVLPLILITPFMAVGAIAYHYDRSFLSLLAVLLGAILGTVPIGLSGIYWLQIIHRRWMESQAAGFIFLPYTLPICAYTGAVAGASLAGILSAYPVANLPSPVFQIIALGFTVVLAGLIPTAIATINFLISDKVNQLTFVLILVICGSVASSWFASKLADWLVTNLFNYTIHQAE